jgi:hypothetical protein
MRPFFFYKKVSLLNTTVRGKMFSSKKKKKEMCGEVHLHNGNSCNKMCGLGAIFII